MQAFIEYFKEYKILFAILFVLLIILVVVYSKMGKTMGKRKAEKAALIKKLDHMKFIREAYGDLTEEKILSDNGENLIQLDTIISSPQIHLKDVGKLSGINVPPLLHNKTIFITGVFKHGSISDMFTILQSYGATVVTDFDEFIDLVLVGDIKDGINGDAILGARGLKIPVVDETPFFNHYGIDEDLESNLV